MQVGEVRYGLGLDLGQGRDEVLAHGLAQPAVGAILEKKEPLVPVAFGVEDLDPSQHLEGRPVEDPGGPDLDGSSVGLQVGYLPQQLDVHVMADQQGTA